MPISRSVLLFGAVGIAGLLVDVAVLALLHPWLGPYGARLVSFMAAASTTWWLRPRSSVSVRIAGRLSARSCAHEPFWNRHSRP